MILILNLSLEPFFCAAIVDGKVLWQESIPNTKESGQVLFDVLARYKDSFDTLEWIGSVSGPGGFATLRIAASFCNTLAYRYNVPVRQVRADKWMNEWVFENGYEGFLLNSFGKKVFVGTKKGIEVCLIDDLPEKDYWVGSLPEQKQDLLNNKIDQKNVSIESLYQILEQTLEQKVFVPDYMYDVV